MSNRFKYLLLSIIFLNLLDIATTLYGLSLGLVEVNPLHGLPTLHQSAVKMVFVLAFCVISSITYLRAEKENARSVKLACFGILAFLNVFFAAIVFNNLYCIFLVLSNL